MIKTQKISTVLECQAADMKPQHISGLPHVVIIGAGFGGLSAAKALGKAPVNLTVIDRRNYHLFQPLLYQVATAALSPADIAWPIRSILRGQENTRVMMNTVSNINSTTKTIAFENGDSVSYDYLIIATGARHSYFGKDDWGKHAPGIKTIADATNLRQKILLAFEKAETEQDPHERERLLTFVIIGGGPTGVEMAGAIAELARHSIAKDFKHISPKCSRIILMEAGKRILAPFDEKLSISAAKTLEKMGVEIITDVRVDNLNEYGIVAKDLKIESRNIVWAAGVKASRAGEWLGAITDQSGRVIVDNQLNVQGYKDIFVIGDTASYTPDGHQRSLPGVAPVAKQMGEFVGNLLAARIAVKEKETAKVFCYKDYGSMATVGRNSAVADFKFVKITGFFGWMLWGIAHVYFLVGIKNRAAVTLSWFWQYVTWQRGVRLITSDNESNL